MWRLACYHGALVTRVVGISELCSWEHSEVRSRHSDWSGCPFSPNLHSLRRTNTGDKAGNDLWPDLERHGESQLFFSTLSFTHSQVSYPKEGKNALQTTNNSQGFLCVEPRVIPGIGLPPHLIAGL